jgi:hypothetical protein
MVLAVVIIVNFLRIYVSRLLIVAVYSKEGAECGENGFSLVLILQCDFFGCTF